MFNTVLVLKFQENIYAMEILINIADSYNLYQWKIILLNFKILSTNTIYIYILIKYEKNVWRKLKTMKKKSTMNYSYHP